MNKIKKVIHLSWYTKNHGLDDHLCHLMISFSLTKLNAFFISSNVFVWLILSLCFFYPSVSEKLLDVIFLGKSLISSLPSFLLPLLSSSVATIVRLLFLLYMALSVSFSVFLFQIMKILRRRPLLQPPYWSIEPESAMQQC